MDKLATYYDGETNKHHYHFCGCEQFSCDCLQMHIQEQTEKAKKIEEERREKYRNERAHILDGK